MAALSQAVVRKTLKGTRDRPRTGKVTEKKFTIKN